MTMRLFERVKEYFDSRGGLGLDGDGGPADVELRASTAVLLLEAAYGDEEYVWSEHRVIVRGLEHAFGIGRSETLELLERANEIRPPAVSLSDVTKVIRDRYDEEQRRAILTLLWRVIGADAVVEEWEAAFATHVAAAVGIDPETAAAVRDRALGD
jgi:uncharacterized tellurite resistance protein B-like protein